jgi:tripartite-type tricarboxylate transporter receptor subunit TctC
MLVPQALKDPQLIPSHVASYSLKAWGLTNIFPKSLKFLHNQTVVSKTFLRWEFIMACLLGLIPKLLRWSLLCWGSWIILSSPINARAQTYPLKAISLITPFPAGGPTDSIARLMSIELAKKLGQAVVVDNRPGAGGNIGCEIVARATPDGYTLLFTSSSTHSIGAAFGKKLPFNYDADFTPIAHVADAPNIFLLTKNLSINTLKDFIDYAKSHPDALNFASAGNGTIMHLTGEYFDSLTGVKMMHIPYKGSGLAMPDLMSGKVHVLFDSVVSGMQHVQDGKLTAIAITSKKRIPNLPNVPTLMEIGAPFGLKDFVSEVVWGMYGPKNLPPSVTQRINLEVNRVLELPNVKQELFNFGATTGGGTPQEFNKVMLDDRSRWAKVIVEQKIQAE